MHASGFDVRVPIGGDGQTLQEVDHGSCDAVCSYKCEHAPEEDNESSDGEEPAVQEQDGEFGSCYGRVVEDLGS